MLHGGDLVAHGIDIVGTALECAENGDLGLNVWSPRGVKGLEIPLGSEKFIREVRFEVRGKSRNSWTVHAGPSCHHFFESCFQVHVDCTQGQDAWLLSKHLGTLFGEGSKFLRFGCRICQNVRRGKLWARTRCCIPF